MENQHSRRNHLRGDRILKKIRDFGGKILADLRVGLDILSDAPDSPCHFIFARTHLAWHTQSVLVPTMTLL